MLKPISFLFNGNVTSKFIEIYLKKWIIDVTHFIIQKKKKMKMKKKLGFRNYSYEIYVRFVCKWWRNVCNKISRSREEDVNDCM